MISAIAIALLRIMPVAQNDATGKALTALLLFLLIASVLLLFKNKKQHNTLVYDATHDALTGLYNRRGFEMILSDCEDQDVAMVLLDADGFKKINDVYGHVVGDRVLKNIASVLTKHFRKEDFICRIGGDEFVVVLPNLKPQSYNIIAKRLDSVKKDLADSDDLPGITVSAGITFYNKECEARTIEETDKVLYAVKGNGGNHFMAFV